jgi:hypothetical protein
MIVHARGCAIAGVKQEIALADEEMEFLDHSREAVPAVAVRPAACEAQLQFFQVEAGAAASLHLQEVG